MKKFQSPYSLLIMLFIFLGCQQTPTVPELSQPSPPPPPVSVIHTRQFASQFLVESQRWAVFLPQKENLTDLPLVILFDGQNHERLGLLQTLNQLWFEQNVKPFALVALWAGSARLENYGIPGRPDYQGRGARGEAFGKFLLQELLPELEKNYPITKNPRQRFLVGFSFTGLGALAQVLTNPTQWGGAIIMSGSFWWRSGTDAQNTRIILDVIQKLPQFPRVHRFWMMAGTAEETSDRDGDGIIDVVDDTLDVVQALKQKGYPDALLSMSIIEGGRHHESTWLQHLPSALKWLFVDQQ
jgi:enterochelin esterase-like enzyme